MATHSDVAATGAEILSVWDSVTRPRINSARSLGDLPLAVLSVTEQPLVGETLKALQADLTALSSNSVQRTITGELAVASGVLGFVAEASLDLRMAAHAQESQSG